MPEIQQYDGHPHQHVLPSGLRVALGRPRVEHDARNLKLARYVNRGDLPAPPDALIYSDRTPHPGMFANDRIGDCTRATQAHVLMLHTALVGQMVIPTEQEVVEAYSRTTGYDPRTGDNDNGDIEVNVLRDWRQNALHDCKLHAFAEVDTQDLNMVRVGMQLFAGLYIGVGLPISAQSQTGAVWDAHEGPDGEPGSWGGHAVNVVDFDWQADPKTLTVVTWGTTQKMTQAFWRKYVDEAYALITDAWLQTDPHPAIDLAGLERDLGEVGHQQH